MADRKTYHHGNLRAELLEHQEASLHQSITRTEAAYQERLQQLENQLPEFFFWRWMFHVAKCVFPP